MRAPPPTPWTARRCAPPSWRHRPRRHSAPQSARRAPREQRASPKYRRPAACRDRWPRAQPACAESRCRRRRRRQHRRAPQRPTVPCSAAHWWAWLAPPLHQHWRRACQARPRAWPNRTDRRPRRAREWSCLAAAFRREAVAASWFEPLDWPTHSHRRRRRQTRRRRRRRRQQRQVCAQ
jgi:hypothetical protein